jgi:hypothetical protein
MLTPLYGFFEGDTLGILVLAHDDMTLGQAAEKLRAAVRPRVECRGEIEVVLCGRVVPSDSTVAEVGLSALDRFDVRPRSR